MKVKLMPDVGGCRLCGSTTGQHEFWDEVYMGAGQSLRRCGYCAGLYLGPDFTPGSLHDFYSHYYRNLFLTEVIGHNQERFFKQRFDDCYALERQRIVSPLVPTGGGLFEMGSGFGNFLGIMARARPDISLYASEHDGENREVRCKGMGIHWINDFEDLIQRQSFDAIVAFHVLEHLVDPIAFIRWAAQVLKPNAHLIIEVPDAGSTWSTRNFVHPAHLTYFTSITLRRGLQSVGLDVIRCGVHPSGAPFSGTLLAVARLPAVSPRSFPMEMASPEEIIAIDKKINAVDWTIVDKLKGVGKRAMVRIFGRLRTGAVQRWLEYRRLKRAWDGFRPI
jgi:SAM-dependent methyltransferase